MTSTAYSPGGVVAMVGVVVGVVVKTAEVIDVVGVLALDGVFVLAIGVFVLVVGVVVVVVDVVVVVLGVVNTVHAGDKNISKVYTRAYAHVASFGR